MPQKKSKDSLRVETNEYHVFDPGAVKQGVEIQVKEKPSVESLEKIEKVGKVVRRTAKKTKAAAGGSKEKKKVVKTTLDKSLGAATFSPIPLKKEGYILIITEKPQAAAKIAGALAEGKERKVVKNKVSYYELHRGGKEIVVGCAGGHLFTVSQTVKGTSYPIFDIGWFPNFAVRKKDFTQAYYLTIKSLVKGASELVVATDFDVEGEVIGYNILRFIANQADAKRMKFSSLTSSELQESFDNRQQSIEWGQAIAGETRHFIDWLYGINLSRALMAAIKTTGKFRIMSIGRVQGPTLKLIVDKELEIREFKTSTYWQIFADVNDGKHTLVLKHTKDITKKEELDMFRKLEGREGLVSTKKTQQSIHPPAPFDLTSLQTEAYKFHGITPSNTLAIAQKLYLAGLISYPRTSSQKIPDAIKPLEILKKLERHFETLVSKAVRKKPVEGAKSDPAHPAITPTGNVGDLEGEDEKIYELIVRRFISCFCDDAKLANKKVELVVDGLKFNAKGMEILTSGWMDVYKVKMEEKEIKDMDGSATIDKVTIEEKETKPPKRYSPASILSELEKRNLGTKATRANILETLYERNYIKEKQIQATELGIRLIESLQTYSPIIVDEKLTREIEKDMDAIRTTKKDLQKKEGEIIAKAQSALKVIAQDFQKKEVAIGTALLAANQALWESEKEDNTLEKVCPACNKGNLLVKFTPRFKSYFIACSNYPACKQTFSLPKSLIKNTVHKNCEGCGWPLLLSIKKAKRPWIFCFNPECPNKKPLDANGNDAVPQSRYVGQATDINRKKIEDIEQVEE